MIGNGTAAWFDLADLFGDGDGERDLPVGLLLVTDGGNAGALDEGQTLGQATEEAPHVRCFGGTGGMGSLSQEFLYVPLSPGYGQATLYNDGNGRQLLLLLRQLQKRPGMTFGESGGPQCFQDRGTVTKSRSLLATADWLFPTRGRLLLGEAAQLHKAGEALCLFDEIQIPALEIFHQAAIPDCPSSMLMSRQGTSSKPAIFAARSRRSPAMSS